MRLQTSLLAGALLLPLSASAQDTPAPAPPGPAAAAAPLSEDEKILHLLNRFTPGATPALVEDVRRAGISAWLERQLRGDEPESDAYNARLKRFETLGLSTAEIFEQFNPRPEKGASPQDQKAARREAMIPTLEMLAWIVLRSVYSRHDLREVSCDFFRNHFAVSIEKGAVKFLVVDWEREVIHKHALGNFGDMLEASARHPAMLFYLDNCLSRRPATPEELRILEAQARRRASEEKADEIVDNAKQRGLNENYGRELLELHTLGVDRFYTQDDVLSAARCLTGWSIGRQGGVKGRFSFDPRMHCPGDKPFLGGVIRENTDHPLAEGEELLARLKEHPGTAEFLSRKLCRWLVHDDPGDALVARVAKAFQAAHGDLPKVFTAIVQDPEFFARENFRAKYKRPWEFVVSALRATGAEVTHTRPLIQALAGMNESIYRCADPTGYYDQAEAWRDPGSMAIRWTFAGDLANGRIGGASIPASFYRDLTPGRPREWKDILVRKILPVAGIGEATSAGLDRLIEAQIAKNPKILPTQLGPVITAALLGSPEFQKQ